jgi:hypothetical protein
MNKFELSEEKRYIKEYCETLENEKLLKIINSSELSSINKNSNIYKRISTSKINYNNIKKYALFSYLSRLNIDNLNKFRLNKPEFSENIDKVIQYKSMTLNELSRKQNNILANIIWQSKSNNIEFEKEERREKRNALKKCELKIKDPLISKELGCRMIDVLSRKKCINPCTSNNVLKQRAIKLSGRSYSF